MRNASEVLLTIGIPTYNRARYLDECLASIWKQQGVDLTRVEILISDNASADETTLVAKKWRDCFPRFTYIRHSDNIGSARNFRNVLDRAAGSYVWLFSDDDLMSNLALQAVCPLLLRDKYVFVWVGVETAEMNDMQGENLIMEADHSQLLSVLDSGLISRCIFRKESYLATQKTFLNTCADHMGVVFEVALMGTSMILTTPLVYYRPGNSPSAGPEFINAYPVPEENFLSFAEVIDDFHEQYSRRVIKRYKKNMFYTVLMFVMIGMRIQGKELSELYRAHFFRCYKALPSILVLGALIYYSPGIVLRCLRRLYRLARRWCAAGARRCAPGDRRTTGLGK